MGIDVLGWIKHSAGSALLIAAVWTQIAPASAAVGAIPGQFAVSETGAATYTIPIAVPPGTAGMEPKLALTYNSQGGNGLLGVGWSLSGLSAITRCSRTIAQGDGVTVGVAYEATDRYCLDGQRLMAVSGTYGANGTEYRTELESFTKVVSYGTAGNGPAWFKVWTKSGQVVEYGNTLNSSIEAQGKSTVAVWAVNKISDTKGNYLTVAYTEDEAKGEYIPERIQYTGHGSQDPTNVITFTYETRPDTSEQYVAGSKVSATQRLTTIQTYTGTTLTNEYRMAFENGLAPNNASRLVNVTECAGDGTCLPATTFSWQTAAGELGFKEVVGWTLPTNDVETGGALSFLNTGDVNGDGLTDIVATYSGTIGLVNRLYLSTGDAFSTSATPLPVGFILLGDFDRDGRADLLNSDGNISLSNGSGFGAPQNWGLSASSILLFSSTGDTNGDGYADLLLYTNPPQYEIRYSNSIGFGQGTAISGCCPQATAILGDVDGDGRADVVQNYGAVFLASDTGFKPDTHWDGSNFIVCGSTGDVNGDGRADVSGYCFYPGGVRLSTGLGFTAAGYQPGALADLNGDGRADLVHTDGKVRLAEGSSPDLLIGITNGLGAHTHITYKTVADSATYTPETGSNYPIRDTLTSALLHLVSETTSDDGTGRDSRQTYHYTGAKTHLQGRGFLGFRVVESTNVQTGIVSRTEYRQDFPYTGLASHSEQRLSGGQLIGQTDTSYCLMTLGTGAATRYSPYAQQSVETSYELDGSQVTQATTTQSYDDWGNPTQILVSTNDGYTKTTTNTYSNDSANWFLGRLTRASVTSAIPGGQSATRTSAFEYSATSGLLTKEIVEPDIPSLRLDTAYTYDAYGNKTAVTVSSPATGDAAIVSRTSTTGYDTQGRFPTSSSNALGHSETRVYDARLGKVTSLTGPNGLITTWQYDGFGRKTLETRSDGSTTAWSYEDCTVSCPAYAKYYVVTQSSGAPESRVYYDMHNREVRSATVGFDGRWVNKDTEYDVNGRVSRVSRPYYDNEPAQWTTSYYDDLGRPYQIDDPDGGITRRSYQGLTTITTNPKIQTKTEVKNSQGQLVSVADADNYTTTFSYDAFSNLTRTTDPSGNAIVNGYDPRGRKTAMNDPDMGNWTYAYNALGELIRQTDAKNQTVSNTYDKLGRLTQRAEADLITTWYYDQYKNGSVCAVGLGKLCEISADNNMSQQIYYEGYGGRPFIIAHTIDKTYWSYRSYDPQGRVAQQSVQAEFAGGFGTTNVYNTNGYLSEVHKGDSTGPLLWRADTLDASGHVTRETFGNGVTTDRVFNAENGRLTSIQANGPNGAVQNQSFSYDSLGNLATRADPLLASSETFTYDSLNRLTAATRDGATTTVVYDAQGNITHKSDVGAYSYTGGKPHAVTQAGANTYTYDANGNQLSGAGRTLGWTSYNLPNQIVEAINGTPSTTTFLYDYNHVRAKQTSPGKTVIYLNPRIDLGGHYHKEVAGTVTTESYYFYAGGQVVGAYVIKTNASPQTNYFHADHLGSISVVTDQAGQVITRYQYDPWGKRVLAAGSAATMHGFTGHEHLDDGLIHMNGRVYDPVLGRFLSADPTIPDATNLQAYNRYSYVFNNPLSLTDPSGFRPFWEQKWFKQAATIAVAAWVGPIAFSSGFWGVGTALGGGTAGLIGGTIAGGALAGMTTQLLTTGSTNGWQKAGVSAMMFNMAAGFGAANSASAERIAAHAAAGCASSSMYGGDCGSGALAAGFGKYATNHISGGWGPVGQMVAVSVVGGTASALGGGSFANGARTAAFGYLFNSVTSCMQSGACTANERLFVSGAAEPVCYECIAIPAVRTASLIDRIVSFFSDFGPSRPGGIPEDWAEMPSRDGNNKWVDPTNPKGGSYVRERADGTLTQVKNGQALDVNGKPAPGLSSPEAHFPRDQWTFRP